MNARDEFDHSDLHAPLYHTQRHRWIAIVPSACLFIWFVYLSIQSLRSARDNALLVDCISNGKQFSMALLNYESATGSLPPAHLVDSRHARLHSWRTLLLPFLEEHEIYGRIDLTQPWNSQANLFLSKIPLWVMHCPVDRSDACYTSYLAVVGPSTAFPGAHPVRLEEITDGATNTIIAVEQSRTGVLWAEPRDLNPETIVGDIRSGHSRGRVATFGDGHVKVISHDVDPAVLHALTTATGREPIANTDY